MTTPRVIHWFRQDLRLSDNPSFAAAAKAGQVLPIYILDEHNAGEASLGGASRVWLHHSLEQLNKSLTGKLLCFSGNALTLLPKLVEKYKINSVYWNRCYEPWRIQRDKALKETLKAQNINVHSFNSALLWEPWKLLKADKTPYKVFTPFYKNACTVSHERGSLISKPSGIKWVESDTAGHRVKSLRLLPNHCWAKDMISHWQVGEQSAQDRLEQFLDKGISDYKQGRNFPANENVSRLSPHLHFGEISPNQIWHAAMQIPPSDNRDHFLSELGWREFSYYLLYHFPELPQRNLQTKFDNFPWLKDDNALQCWQQGQTGYPIVDAGMRELWQTGYMHNRLRMIVGSFLVKNLLLHWHKGEAWFWDCLVDADLASNSASWQWVAGCGTDAAPYFRIFNPVTQGQKFDPEGEYTRQYVPELKALPNKYLFNPWDAPSDVLEKAKVNLGKTYPKPIVNLKDSRNMALDIFKKL